MTIDTHAVRFDLLKRLHEAQAPASRDWYRRCLDALAILEAELAFPPEEGAPHT